MLRVGMAGIAVDLSHVQRTRLRRIGNLRENVPAYDVMGSERLTSTAQIYQAWSAPATSNPLAL